MRIAPWFVALTLLAACGKSSSVEGKWRLDVDKALAATSEAVKRGVAGNPSMEKAVRGMEDSIRRTLAATTGEVELKSDHTFESRMTVAGKTTLSKGRWEERGEVVVLTPAQGEGGGTLELTKRDGRLEGKMGAMTVVLTRS